MVTEVAVTVRVTKVGIHLAKVIHGDGYQLVCGGRLVSETRNGVKSAHPDLPQYTPEMFPGGWDAYDRAIGDARNEAPGVRVEIQRDGRFVPCESPRTAAYLFGAHTREDVVAWIRRAAR